VRRRHQENGAKTPYRRRQGGVPCPFDRNTTPTSRKRTLRDIFLIAQPPLLAVMPGGEFAFLKMALTWTAVRIIGFPLFIDSQRVRIRHQYIGPALHRNGDTHIA
jgi:hypothetical protein